MSNTQDMHSYVHFTQRTSVYESSLCIEIVAMLNFYVITPLRHNPTHLRHYNL